MYNSSYIDFAGRGIYLLIYNYQEFYLMSYHKTVH